jgi:hypothetical protein
VLKNVTDNVEKYYQVVAALTEILALRVLPKKPTPYWLFISLRAMTSTPRPSPPTPWPARSR